MSTIKNKQNFILDLDQTIISGETREELASLRNSIGQKELNAKIKKYDYSDMEEYYKIFERPHLQEFLDYLFENFNVSVWTAASKDYALFIIQNIIIKNKSTERKLDWIFYSYHCTKSNEKYNEDKDLNMLWDVYKLPGYSKSNTVILDDNIYVYNTQPKNCIRIKQFKFKNKKSYTDTVLIDMIPMLDELKKSKNVRIIVGRQ